MEPQTAHPPHPHSPELEPVLLDLPSPQSSPANYPSPPTISSGLPSPPSSPTSSFSSLPSSAFSLSAPASNFSFSVPSSPPRQCSPSPTGPRHGSPLSHAAHSLILPSLILDNSARERTVEFDCQRNSERIQPSTSLSTIRRQRQIEFESALRQREIEDAVRQQGTLELLVGARMNYLELDGMLGVGGRPEDIAQGTRVVSKDFVGSTAAPKPCWEARLSLDVAQAREARRNRQSVRLEHESLERSERGRSKVSKRLLSSSPHPERRVINSLPSPFPLTLDPLHLPSLLALMRRSIWSYGDTYRALTRKARYSRGNERSGEGKGVLKMGWLAVCAAFLAGVGVGLMLHGLKE